jgi:hypothetical protein
MEILQHQLQPTSGRKVHGANRLHALVDDLSVGAAGAHREARRAFGLRNF